MPIPRKIALLCLLLASATGAQASQVLSLPQALTAAFAQNPELAAAGREIGIADGERRQAGLLPNPELAWEVEDTRRDTSTTTVTLSQPLELGGKRGARIDVARGAQDAADLELQRQRNGLRADVIQAFYRSSTAQQRWQLTEQSVQLAERGLSVAQGSIKAGKSSPVEATRAQVQLSQVRLELRRAERDRADEKDDEGQDETAVHGRYPDRGRGAPGRRSPSEAGDDGGDQGCSPEQRCHLACTEDRMFQCEGEDRRKNRDQKKSFLPDEGHGSFLVMACAGNG